MREEVVCASKFLVDLVKLNNNNVSISDKELERLRELFCECLCDHYKDHWFPDKPHKGSGYRCIRINGTIDPLIARAGALMGLAAKYLHSLFPTEFTMWVDPEEVCYRIGENGSICILYQPKPPPASPPSPASLSPSSSNRSSPVISESPIKLALSPRSQSASPSPCVGWISRQQSSPSKSAVQSQFIFSKNQLVYSLMAAGAANAAKEPINPGFNCKESLFGSGLESLRGIAMESLSVSS